MCTASYGKVGGAWERGYKMIVVHSQITEYKICKQDHRVQVDMYKMVVVIYRSKDTKSV